MKEYHIHIGLSTLMLTFFCTLITQFALQIKEQNEYTQSICPATDNVRTIYPQSQTIRILTIFNLIMTILFFPFLHINKF